MFPGSFAKRSSAKATLKMLIPLRLLAVSDCEYLIEPFKEHKHVRSHDIGRRLIYRLMKVFCESTRVDDREIGTKILKLLLWMKNPLHVPE